MYITFENSFDVDLTPKDHSHKFYYSLVEPHTLGLISSCVKLTGFPLNSMDDGVIHASL